MNDVLVAANVARAAEAIAGAEGLLVTAGAGMGVDSGLPDFRGDEGFWKAYPPFARLGLSFVDLAQPRWFHEDPALAWGFYGHRLELYRRTVPHAGFGLLRSWARARPRGGFVFTSNVDGQFQRAGFDEHQVLECHGSLAYTQCLAGCGAPLADASALRVDVDESTMRARPPLPSCARCGGVVRPNVLMFGDADWDEAVSAAQAARFETWRRPLALARLVVVECGAGTAVPTVRRLGDGLARAGATLVRINVREPEVDPGANRVSLPLGAADALGRIAARLG